MSSSNNKNNQQFLDQQREDKVEPDFQLFSKEILREPIPVGYLQEDKNLVST